MQKIRKGSRVSGECYSEDPASVVAYASLPQGCSLIVMLSHSAQLAVGGDHRTDQGGRAGRQRATEFSD